VNDFISTSKPHISEGASAMMLFAVFRKYSGPIPAHCLETDYKFIPNRFFFLIHNDTLDITHFFSNILPLSNVKSYKLMLGRLKYESIIDKYCIAIQNVNQKLLPLIKCKIFWSIKRVEAVKIPKFGRICWSLKH
jgi:hypothetical protein